jgi:hypothetical protein
MRQRSLYELCRISLSNYAKSVPQPYLLMVRKNSRLHSWYLCPSLLPALLSTSPMHPPQSNPTLTLRGSSRKKKSTNKALVALSEKRERCCRRCPGGPPLNKCPHSSKGKAWIALHNVSVFSNSLSIMVILF